MEPFKLMYYRDLIAKTIAEKRFFRLYGYADCPKLRAELLKRGYLEHIPLSGRNPLGNLPLEKLAENASKGNEYEQTLISRLLEGRAPDFIFIPDRSYYVHQTVTHQINRVKFVGYNFCLKHELCCIVDIVNQHLRNDLLSNDVVRMPRTVRIVDDLGIDEFRECYNWTMITSLVLYMNKNPTTLGNFFCQRPIYGIEADGLELALNFITRQIEKRLGTRRSSIPETPFTRNQWRAIERTYIGVVRNQQSIYTSQVKMQYYIDRVSNAAEQIKLFWPETKIEGYRNIWIVKPDGCVDGEGIIMSDEFRKIKSHVEQHDDFVFVIQKYMERPFLIHETKFHIRNYLLLRIDETHFNAFFHPSCMIKLASEPFTLKNLRTKGHLTNISVQKNFSNASKKLPDSHMLTLERLQEYLRDIGHPNAYFEKMYPSMKETLQQLSEESMSHIAHEKGNYEIFGVDWMVAEDFSCYLLEVNRSPSLEHFSVVSTIVLNEILEDLIKVVVDNYNNPKASCGGFENILRLQY
ncbi:tubulin glycylase 3B-like [Culicoides brevitarsis]|uniref:tubulin glycylase 3B-like n=1 Tax=Culicoides brevitarsis TaxID=469753 RepID=UPI00307C3FFB